MLIALTATGAAAQEDVSVLHVEYQIERFSRDGAPTETLTGEFYFAGDGRYRHNRVVEDYEVSEIWLPEQEERIAVNHIEQARPQRSGHLAFPDKLGHRLGKSPNV